MIIPPAGVRVVVATRPVDFRKGADGLAAIAQSVLMLAEAGEMPGVAVCRMDGFCEQTFYRWKSK